MRFLKKSPIIALVIITLFAFGQRFYNISSNPPSLNWDEISHGYNAFSILKTGADEWGFKFPLIFRAFGDFKLPLYIYLTAIPVYFLGLTTTAVRLVSVLAGTLAIPGVYLLSKELFSPKGPTLKGAATAAGPLDQRVEGGSYPRSLPLLSAFLLAISPWHFFISRPALEANLALTLVIFGFFSLLKALKNQKYFLLSAVLLGLSLHTYNTARIFVPLLLVLFYLIYKPKLKINLSNTLAVIFLTLSMFIVGFQIYSGTGTARYSKLAILSDNAVYQLGESRLNSPLPPVLAKLRFNRPVYFLTQFTKYYVSYFSPGFIYQTQGSQYQFAIPGKNMFTLPISLLSLIGGAYLVFKKKSKSTYFLFSWLLASPVAAALTADPPQALRPTPMIPVIIILAGLGITWVASLFKKYRWAKSAVSGILILSCLVGYIRYLNEYYSQYPVKYSWSWQYGYEQVIDYVSSNQDNYDQVIFTKYYGEPHIFFAFFTQTNPQVLQPGGDSLRFQKTNWFWTDRIKNTYFVNDWEIPKVLGDTLPLESGGEVPTKNSLLVVSPESLPTNAKILKTINFLDSTPAFYIITPALYTTTP